MKLFGNIYTDLDTSTIANCLCLEQWCCIEIEPDHFELEVSGVKLTLEGSKEILLFGSLETPLAEIDQWVAGLSDVAMHFALDLHADEARLIRRYHQ